MIFARLQTSGIGVKNSCDLIADFSENRKDVVFRAFRLSRIIECRMIPAHHPGKHWASLISISANRDHRVNWCTKKLVQMLGTMFRNINSDLVHDLNRNRVNLAGGRRTRTFDSNHFTRRSSKNSLSHLTSARITGTQNQDQRFQFVGHVSEGVTRFAGVAHTNSANGRIGCKQKALPVLRPAPLRLWPALPGGLGSINLERLLPDT